MFVISFLHKFPDCFKRAFYIGEYGTPFETQLYHHFKFNRYKMSLTWQFPNCYQEMDTNQLESWYLFIPKRFFLSITMYEFFATDLNKRKTQKCFGNSFLSSLISLWSRINIIGYQYILNRAILSVQL